MRSMNPRWDERLRFLALWPGDLALGLLALRFGSFQWAFTRLAPRYLAWAGRWRARRAHYRALRRVPAYAALARVSADGAPVTDKPTYIDAFPMAARCVGGRLPMQQAAIDESSGSTGRPYNWVRGVRERQESHRSIAYFVAYCFGPEPFITLNAFSMGAWATGVNMGVALQRHSLVKCCGPDVDKLLQTLKAFGPEQPYLITGYPPFLKLLLDQAEQQGFDLAPYRLRALVGGEGMSEGLRDYLLRRFEKVYSGYGATDLEIGIAGETPLSVALRRLAHRDARVREALFGAGSRVPMLFQYNPLMHHVEVNAAQELVFSISRPSLVSPRLRYNIHDEGGILRYDQLAAKLRDLGVDLATLTPDGPPPLTLPFVWVYGRKDHTISVMGANIYPEDLEQVLYGDPALALRTRSYCMGLDEGPQGAVRPAFAFEVDGPCDAATAERYRQALLEGLTRLNADFRAARQEYPEALAPVVTLHGPGEGPFAAQTGRIKQIRLFKPAASSL